MKNAVFLFLFISISLSSITAINPLQTTLDSIATKWVPDKREAICNFNAGWRKKRVYITGETTELDAIKDLYKLMKMRKIRFFDGIKLLPDTSTDKRSFGLVRVSVMNIRKWPTHNAELLSQAVMGTPVRILKDSGDYYLVQTPDKYIGWATHASVVRKTNDEMKAWKNEKRMLFTEKADQIYADTLKNEVVSDIVMTSLIVASKVDKDWTEMRMPDGRRGYIESKNLTEFASWAAQVQPNAASIISMSNQFKGISYLWGGTSTHMLDCSGFIKTLFFMGGLLLPRDASLQYKMGSNVEITSEFSELKAGDLLFFGQRLPFKLRVTHVGMYIGNQQFIHESEWIHTNSLDASNPDFSKYYRGRLLLVKRIIGTKNENLRISNNQMYF